MSSALIEWPVRIVAAVGRGIKTALGPLITKEFWIKVMALCAKEMVAAFMKTLGGKFLSYGMAREDPELKKTTQSAASSAFSSTPRPDFSSTYNQFPSFNQKSATPFPGFGS